MDGMYPNSNATTTNIDGDRNEKLLAARKKLKQFQNRRRSTSRSTSGIDNNRSYGVDENRGGGEDDRGQRRHRSQQRQSGEDGEMIGGDGRPLSECYTGYSTESLAESTASTTKATKASRANRRTSAASSRYLETPEPVRISIAPEQQQEILYRQQYEKSQTGGAFYHDEQRSPFQRVKRESESSETTLNAKSIDSQTQHFSLQNKFSLSSTSSADVENHNQQLRHAQKFPPGNDDTNLSAAAASNISPRSRSGDEEIILNMDENRTPINEYKPPEQLGQFDGNLSAITEPIGRNLVILKERTLKMDGGAYEKPSMADAATRMSTSDERDIQQSALQVTIQQQQIAMDQLNEQLQQLHNHYAQLHTAYSDVIQQQQQHASNVGNDDKSRELDELRKQIQLHLHTMSVLVDEKTDLQSQLRQVMEIANQKHFENEELQGRLKANRERLTLIENELESHGGTHRNLEDTLKRQMSELERLRKESAQWQARSSEAQQDRQETNAKLKLRNREVDDLTTRLRETEKQLHLKDIYIQQLTGGPGALQQQQALGEELEQQRRVNADLYGQLENAGKVIEQWRWDAEQSRERYEAYVKQLNENASGLAERLEHSEKEKYNLQIRCDQFEKQLTSLNQEGNNQQETSSRPSAEDLDNLKVILNEFEQGLKAANGKTADLELQLKEKETLLSTLNDQLIEKDRRIRQLNDQLNEKYQHDDSAKSLLEQLHNEKATVSRAVAQNIELKKQLVELQEKFVLMSESSMDNANKLETSERQYLTLKEKFDEKDEEIKLLQQKHNEELTVQREQMSAVSAQNFERSHMEDRIRHYEVVQKHYDSELERTQREIGHLKVENADLKQRLTILNDANRNLQTEREHLVQQQSKNEEQQSNGGELEKLRTALAESEVVTNTLTSEIETLKNNNRDDELKSQLMTYEEELTEARRRLHFLTTENSELHRIMEQNAEDENQNTIHVELHQALNRSTTLSHDNDRLRQRIQELEIQLSQEKSLKESMERSSATEGESRDETSSRDQQQSQEHLHGSCSHQNLHLPHQHEKNGDDRSSVCSEHYEQRHEAVNLEAFENMKSAMEQLQNRFAKAMNQNADLSDQNQQLEHLITQLQSETETIGEYITIYQHQRKTIRERLKEKEDYVARLAREKEDVQAKLTELQQLVVRLLHDKGSLRPYAQAKPVYGRPPVSPPSVAPRKPRGLSQTLVDEVSGSEISLHKNSNNGGSEGTPTPTLPTLIPDTPLNSGQSNGDVSPTISEDFQNQIEPTTTLLTNNEKSGGSMTSDTDLGLNEILPDLHEDDATAERILRLLTEMRRPDLVNSLPPVERSLHCKYCTGRLMML